jgi:outer membrane biosynthesis protein TonB
MTNIDKLEEWENRLKEAQENHQIASKRNEKYHIKLGVATLSISIFVVLGFLYKIDFKLTSVESVLTLFAIFSITITSSLQTFLNFRQKSEVHRFIATKYGKLKRDMEQLSFSKTTSQEELEKSIENIMNEWNFISEISPTTFSTDEKKPKKAEKVERETKNSKEKRDEIPKKEESEKLAEEEQREEIFDVSYNPAEDNSKVTIQP